MSFSYFDQGGFSTIAVKDPKMKMLEIFDKVIKRRQMHKGPLTGICSHVQQYFSLSCCLSRLSIGEERLAWNTS